MSREIFFSKTKLSDMSRPGMETPCLVWTSRCDKDGYGRFRSAGRDVGTHRLAWEFEHGNIPDGLLVLHRCDNPPCVAVGHLFLGTNADNMADRNAKGRQARGDTSGARLHPERWARGDAYHARLHPENLARGDAHGSRLHPERVARGDRNGSRLHPESRPRGESNTRAKLTESNVRFIFLLRAQGWTSKRLAAEFGMGRTAIGDILARKKWAHVEIGTAP